MYTYFFKCYPMLCELKQISLINFNSFVNATVYNANIKVKIILIFHNHERGDEIDYSLASYACVCGSETYSTSLG